MAMGAGGPRTFLSEINVTPLVDVMLVLLIIFMITSSLETVQTKERQKEQKKEKPAFQKVPITLPKVNDQRVDMEQERKVVLSLDQQLRFFVGDTKILDCIERVPTLKARVDRGELGEVCDEVGSEFRLCLNELGAKLLENEKIKRDKEIYLRADKAIPYGCALLTMSLVRKAGITRFGLLALSAK